MSKDDCLELSNSGMKRIRKVDTLKREVQRLTRELNQTECALRNAQDELGMWALPKNADQNTVIGLPVGKGFVYVSGVYTSPQPLHGVPVDAVLTGYKIEFDLRGETL